MSTYNPIATQTLTGATSSIIFSNIPQSYTDLVVVINGALSGSAVKSINFNLDTASNYSCTTMIGLGSASSSGRYAEPYIDVSNAAANRFNNIIQINNYSNNVTFKNYLARQDAAATSTETIVGLWRNTNPITTISFSASGGQTYASGTTFSIYAISAGSPKAQGGLVTKDSTYYYHTFLSSGVFTPSQALTCDYLVVAGGGGGSKGYGGGGGAGGLLSSVTATGGGGTLQSALSVTAQSYSIIVGAGGPSMTNGSNSIFSTVTSIGGGKGGDFNTNGSTGGSGGGGGVSNSGTTSGGAGTANQGYAGGSNGGFNSSPYGSGGGGGAGAVGGSAASASINGNGGVGLQLTAWATSTNTGANSGYYAGGGGGDSYLSGNTAGTGGLGGGGAGGGNSGTNNTGGGGGGNNNSLQTLGGSGGSGIVIVRYAI